MDNTEKTLSYYNKNASDFVAGTIDVDFSKVQNSFLSQIKAGGNILDLGCGSGRDSKCFIEKGYKVTAVDGSKEICKKAAEFICQKVTCSTFQDYVPQEQFDGIWACASLLHLSQEDIKVVLRRLSDYLNEDGCFYVSFKYGDYSGDRNGRYFTDFTEESFRELLKEVPDLSVSQVFITTDVRPNRESEKWLNVFLIKTQNP